MPTMHEITLYTYAELGTKAQEKVRDWWNSTTEIFGLQDLFAEQLTEYGYPTDKIEWSLRCSQGDGMAFYGRCDTRKLWVRLLSKVLPKSKRARVYYFVSKYDLRYSVIDITGTSYSYHYSHWNTMRADVERPRESYIDATELDELDALINEIEEEILVSVQNISHKLEAAGYGEIEYQQSDEVVADMLTNYAYKFTEEGKIYE